MKFSRLHFLWIRSFILLKSYIREDEICIDFGDFGDYGDFSLQSKEVFFRQKNYRSSLCGKIGLSYVWYHEDPYTIIPALKLPYILWSLIRLSLSRET
ncbi:hypothetical protein Glove_54g27 [Diversispora epigaea]|uniref:Uncharacterized protein n=1 Tax=Diversispora epigaea TaxID=1348612 RepID=A0A397JH99_9GLOM|nr:hypothetical protein Glove_54g27 [Diversispora epigaea]